MLSVSLCCQATCGLLVWFYFGTFPRYFLLTTLLAIPLTVVVMYVLVIAVASSAAATLSPLPPASATSLSADLVHLFSTLLDGLSGLTLQVLTWLLRLLNSVIHLIASL